MSKGLPVSVTRESARRWGGYVCPDCRFVFRVPQEHGGKGLVCPECRRLLRIPRLDDETAPLVLQRPSELGKAEFSTLGDKSEAVDGGMRKRRGRKRRSSSKRKEQELRWDEDTGRIRRARSGERNWMGRAVIAGAVVLVGVVAIMLWQLGKTSDGDDGGTGSTVDAPQPPSGVAGETGGGPEVEARYDAATVAAAETLARAFLEAKTIGEMAKFVRNPEVALPRMTEAYPSGSIEEPGMAEFNCTGAPELENGFMVFVIRTRDYETKRLNFVETPDGLRIDWESWFGWCEMDWERFTTERPAEGKIFRVVIRPSKYFNFDFADDTKWRSYRLESLNGERMLYGYVERASAMDEALQLDPDLDGELMMLKLRFPDVESNQPQVLIEEVVQKGWVEFLPAHNASPGRL